MQQESAHRYFPSSVSLPNQLLSSITNMQSQLERQIEEGSIQIQNHGIASRIVKTKQNEKIIAKQKLKQLNDIKVELKQKLSTIAKQEKDIKLEVSQLQRKSKPRKEKSMLTKEEMDKIASLKKEQREFENKIKQKMSVIMEHIRDQELNEEQERKFEEDKRRKQRIVKMQEKKIKMAESRSKTLEILDNPKSKIKKQNYTYVQNEKLDQQFLKEQESRIKQIMRDRREKNKIDFQIIRGNAQQHDRIINDRKQQFLFEFQEKSIKKRAETQQYESEHRKRLKTEQQKEKIKKMEEINARKQIRERINEFQSVISEKFMPKSSDESVFVPKKQVQILFPLTKEQSYQKGMQFLKLARKKGKKVVQNQSKLSNSSDKICPPDPDPETLPNTSVSEKYIDYLPQLRKKTGEKNILQIVIKDKKVNSKKFQEVVQWIRKKEERYNIAQHKTPTKNQVSSALEKIKLLNSIYETVPM